MQARYYVVGLNRFASADSIVPDPANPQQFNRYTYALGNPVKFFDPSGHDPLNSVWEAEFERNHGRRPTDQDRIDRLFSLIFPGRGANGSWTDEDWQYYAANRESLLNAQLDWREHTAARGIDRFVYGLERLATYYRVSETDKYVRAVGLFWAGIPYHRFEIGAAASSVFGPIQPYFRETADNWRPALVDDRDPSHHWAGFFYSGYFFGSVGYVANWARDTLTEYNPQDMNNGTIAVAQGSMLYHGYLNMTEVGAAARFALDVRPALWSTELANRYSPPWWWYVPGFHEVGN